MEQSCQKCYRIFCTPIFWNLAFERIFLFNVEVSESLDCRVTENEQLKEERGKNNSPGPLLSDVFKVEPFGSESTHQFETRFQNSSYVGLTSYTVQARGKYSRCYLEPRQGARLPIELFFFLVFSKRNTLKKSVFLTRRYPLLHILLRPLEF